MRPLRLSCSILLHLLFTSVVVHINADHGGENHYFLVEDYADCQPSGHWLGTKDSAQECADACKESDQHKSTQQRFVWVKHDDKNCKCADTECITTHWPNGAVYKYSDTTGELGPPPAFCIYGAGGGEDCSAPGVTNFILAAFFLIWNFMCSGMVLIPIMRIAYFGCQDRQARGMLMVLICPHWLVGIIVPISIGGVFTGSIAICIPYTVNIYKIRNLCRAEKQKGQMIKVHEEVDVFLNNIKTMRLIYMRMSDDRLMLTANGKSYDRGQRNERTLEFLLDPAQANVSNDIVEMLAGKRTRAIQFTDKSGQNVKLVLTRLVGLVNQDSLEADAVPRRQPSVTERVLNLSNPKYQFTAVAMPYHPDAEVSVRQNSGGFFPTQPVVAVAACRVVPANEMEEGRAQNETN